MTCRLLLIVGHKIRSGGKYYTIPGYCSPRGDDNETHEDVKILVIEMIAG